MRKLGVITFQVADSYNFVPKLTKYQESSVAQILNLTVVEDLEHIPSAVIHYVSYYVKLDIRSLKVVEDKENRRIYISPQIAIHINARSKSIASARVSIPPNIRANLVYSPVLQKLIPRNIEAREWTQCMDARLPIDISIPGLIDLGGENGLIEISY